MIHIGDAILDFMKQNELLEKETLEIKEKVGNITTTDLLQIDSVIKLGKLNGTRSKTQRGTNKGK